MRCLSRVFLVTALVVALAAVSASAQTPLKFGFKGGVSIAKATGDDADGYSGRKGLVGGVFTRVSVAGAVVVQAELLYAQKGAEYTVTDTASGHPVDVTLKADYYEIPVLLKYGLKGKGPASISFYGGPVFSFSAASDTEISSNLVGISVAGSVDNYNERGSDLGLALGVGLDLSLGRSLLALDVRYTGGLKDMWEDVEAASIPADLNRLGLYADENTGAAAKMKNSAFSFTIGVMF